jgi:hypothetical protein
MLFIVRPPEPGRNGFFTQHAPLDTAIHHMASLIPRVVPQLAKTGDRLTGKKQSDDKSLLQDGELSMWFGLGNSDLDNPVLLAMNPGTLAWIGVWN